MDFSGAHGPVTKVAGLAVVVATFVGATAAMAEPVTFAQYTELNTTTKNVTFVNNGSSATLNTFDTMAGDHVSFTYTSVPALPSALIGAQDAYLKINGGSGVMTTEAATGTSTTPGSKAQPFNHTITISFTRSTPYIEHGVNYGSNLLTLVLTRLPAAGSSDPELTSSGSGRNPVIAFDNVVYSLTYSSSFLVFAPGSEEDGSITFSSANPVVVVSGSYLRSFSANSTGTFSSDPPPSTLIIPEPASLALLGAGLFGFSFVRRRNA